LTSSTRTQFRDNQIIRWLPSYGQSKPMFYNILNLKYSTFHWQYFTDLRRHNEFQDDSHPPSWTSKFCKFFQFPFASHYTQILNLRKKKFHENRTIRCRVMVENNVLECGVCPPSWILKKTNFSSNRSHYLIQNTQFVIILSCFTDICRHNDFHTSGRPSSWICDDVIILHPVIDSYRLNIAPYFRIDWFASFPTSSCTIGDRRTWLNDSMVPSYSSVTLEPI